MQFHNNSMIYHNLLVDINMGGDISFNVNKPEYEMITSSKSTISVDGNQIKYDPASFDISKENFNIVLNKTASFLKENPNDGEKRLSAIYKNIDYFRRSIFWDQKVDTDVDIQSTNKSLNLIP